MANETTLDAVLTCVAELREANAALRAEVAELRARVVVEPTSVRERLARPGVKATRRQPGARASRRGLLGTAAKVAAAAVAAGVLAEQAGARRALADNVGSFSSSVSGVPAVSAVGTNNADGIDASSDTQAAVWGHSTSGIGVLGQTGSNIAVYAAGFSGTGVAASTSAATKYGVSASNDSNSSTSVAVLGHSGDGSGGLGPGTGVQGEAGDGTGVQGTATSGNGVVGVSDSGYAIYASANTGIGLAAFANTGVGIQGGTAAAAQVGVQGRNTANTAGSVAIYGYSDDGTGSPGAGIGVKGAAAGGFGVSGTATTGVGVVAHSASGTALSAGSGTGSAVVASSGGVGYGLYLTAPSGWAIGCVGRIRVLGAAVGTITLTHGTTTKTVNSTACSGSSQVILTPTSNPQVFMWATAAPGSFTIHASGAPASDVTFNYLLIN